MTRRLRPTVNEHDHVAGRAGALVTLVEYGDYECPFCGRAYAIVAAVRRRLGDRMRFVFRNFPLAQTHAHALAAAEAAEAAGAQGRFWPMHDLLYAHQHALAAPSLIEHAARLHLDVDAFAAALRTHQFIDRIRAELRSGAVSGVHGTPTFFINGHRYDGSYDFDTLCSAVAGAAAAELGA